MHETISFSRLGTRLPCASLCGRAQGTGARARELIHTLHLKVLPKESGYLGLIGQSAQRANIDGHPLAIQSQVYYMLTRDRPINYLHWLAPDDTHILIEGGPVDYFIFHPDGHVEMVTLGRDVAAGERPLVAVPGGCWKALQSAQGRKLCADGQCALARVHARSRTALARAPHGSSALRAAARGPRRRCCAR